MTAVMLPPVVILVSLDGGYTTEFPGNNRHQKVKPQSASFNTPNRRQYRLGNSCSEKETFDDSLNFNPDIKTSQPKPFDGVTCSQPYSVLCNGD